MLLYFPVMHAELAPKSLPEGARLFDPGLTTITGDTVFRPKNLTFSEAEAKCAVNDFLAFGETTPHVRDLSFFAAGATEDFYTDSSLAISAELAARDRDEALHVEEFTEELRKAQLTLLMAWTLEERLMELHGHSERFEGALATFEQSLGLSEDDAEELHSLSLGQDLMAQETTACELQRNWRKILPAMAVLAPPTTTFLTYDVCGILLADLEDMNLKIKMLGAGEETDGLPAGTLIVKAPVWRLAGRTKAPAENSPFAAECVLAILPESNASLHHN